MTGECYVKDSQLFQYVHAETRALPRLRGEQSSRPGASAASCHQVIMNVVRALMTLDGVLFKECQWKKLCYII